MYGFAFWGTPTNHFPCNPDFGGWLRGWGSWVYLRSQNTNCSSFLVFSWTPIQQSIFVVFSRNVYDTFLEDHWKITVKSGLLNVVWPLLFSVFDFNVLIFLLSSCGLSSIVLFCFMFFFDCCVFGWTWILIFWLILCLVGGGSNVWPQNWPPHWTPSSFYLGHQMNFKMAFFKHPIFHAEKNVV